MTNATTHTHRRAHAHGGADSGHPQAHGHVQGHIHVRPRPASLLEASAGARLGMVALLVALLWGGVWWALH
ncbi:MAG: hypothetical protein ACR652_06130 [Methylocystis sp.]|uniref:hypothetical protein n=1 Tax=Methylocystis sp. TaxID=1911079 RepID=UPI003DA6AF59